MKIVKIKQNFTPLIVKVMLPYFKTIKDLEARFPDEQSCIDYFEQVKWNGNPVSPFDHSSKVYKCKNNRYKCKNTGKYFNVKVGTFFEDTKIPLRDWFMALYIFTNHKKGISSHQLSRDLGITQKSAWFMLKRLRAGLGTAFSSKELSGTVEIDETYYGGAEINKHKHKKTPGTQGRSTKTKTAVVGIVQRGETNMVVAVKTSKVDGKSVLKIATDHIADGSKVMTDEWRPYRKLTLNYLHSFVSHKKKEFVKGEAHVNGIEGFWSHLKRGINGIYHWVSKKHLQAYLDEYVFRFNTRKYETCDRFAFALANMDGRLTYQDLINGGYAVKGGYSS